jgi:hypothetical protein
MEITDELFRLRERVAEHECDVASRVAGLADAIGEALAGGRGSSRKGENAAR